MRTLFTLMFAILCSLAFNVLPVSFSLVVILALSVLAASLLILTDYVETLTQE